MSKREPDSTDMDKRFVCRATNRQFHEYIDFDRSLSFEQRPKAKTKATYGEDDGGDHRARH